MLSVALISTTTPTYAKLNKTTTTTPSAVITKAAPGVTTRAVPVSMPEEIKGAIEKITETEMTIKTKDGKSYWIPTLGFSELEGFKNLNLKEGTEVTLKGLQPQKLESAGAVISKGAIAVKGAPVIDINGGTKLDIAGVAGVTGITGITGVKTFAFSDKDHEGKDLFMPEEITANGVTVKLFEGAKSISTKAFSIAVPEEIKGTIEKITETEMTVKTKDGKSYLIPTLGFSKLKAFVDLNLKEGTEVTLKGVQPPMLEKEGAAVVSNITVTEAAAPSIDSKDVINLGPDGIKTFEFSAKDQVGEAMFMPEEITANGTTVKLFENLE
jgi:hypothetical protein